MREDVPGALDGERVDRAVALLTGLSRSEVAGLIDEGAVLVAGRPVKARGRRVRAGQSLEVDVPDRPAGPVPPAADAAVAFAVIHEDRDLVVVDKPAGLVVHPGSGNPGATLVNGLLARYPDLAGLTGAGGDDDQEAVDRPGIVHRLDKGTSGLMVVARTPAAHRGLVAQLAARRVERRYAALAAGTMEADEGLIDAPLGRSGRDPTKVAVQASGREARTRYVVEARYLEPLAATLVEAGLETGRTHQIRVHLAAIGHPVVGDARYGGPAGLGLERPFLHARRLAFEHPVTGAAMEFESALPADLEAAAASLR